MCLCVPVHFIYTSPVVFLPFSPCQTALVSVLLCLQNLTGGGFEENLASMNLQEGVDFFHFNWYNYVHLTLVSIKRGKRRPTCVQEKCVCWLKMKFMFSWSKFQLIRSWSQHRMQRYYCILYHPLTESLNSLTALDYVILWGNVGLNTYRLVRSTDKSYFSVTAKLC